MIRTLCTLLLLAVSIPSNASAQTATTATWKGTLDAGGTKLRLEIDVTENGQRRTGQLRSLDQGNIELEIEGISTDGKLEFAIPQLQAKFVGELSKDKKKATGTFTQRGTKLPLELELASSRPATEAEVDTEPEELKEAWVGELNMGIMKPLMQFRVMVKPDDSPKCYFDSITEGATGFAGTWKIEDNELSFSIPQIRLEYHGKLDATGASVEGTWEQGGRSLPLTLKRQPTEYSSENTWENRPQRPVGPFPYDAQLVEFENSTDELTLAGTLTIPKKPGKHPGVVLISGSGPQDRDESLMEHKPFLVLADYLSRRGIAVLRYDDRGTAKSTGQFAGATTEDFAHDAAAAVEFLKSHARINPSQIGLAGHSEGGLIAPMVCGLRDDISFVVLMAATGVDGLTIINSQTEAMLRTDNTKPEEQEELEIGLKINRLIVTQAAAGNLDPDAPEFRKQLDALIALLPEEDQEEASSNIAAGIKSAEKRLNGNWMKFFINYDPRSALSKIQCPVLAIVGSKDLQVLPDLNMPEIEKALSAGGNSDFEMVTIEGLNHLFQKCETGSMNEYITIQETWNPEAMERIGDWIEQHTTLVK